MNPLLVYGVEMTAAKDEFVVVLASTKGSFTTTRFRVGEKLYAYFCERLGKHVDMDFRDSP